MSARNADPGSNTSFLNIRFGSWDGSSFTADKTVSAAAFALTNIYGNKSGTVVFRDAADATITGAEFDYQGASNSDSAGNHKDFYFGWDSDGESTSAIGSIRISFVDADQEFSSGFDDMAFTVVPEPSSLGIVALSGVLALLRRRPRFGRK